MPLHDMPKRLVPFPLVLIAIVGFFVLGVLYFDLRSKEARQVVNTNVPGVGVENFQPLPETFATSTSEGGETPPLPPVQPEALGLSPETPTSNVPAAAVFDCWRYAWRGDRLIVDRQYKHIAGEAIVPTVGPDTLHLRCSNKTNVVRTPNGRTFFVSGPPSSPRDGGGNPLPDTIAPWTVFEVNPMNGTLRAITELPDARAEVDGLRLMAVTGDGSTIVGFLYVNGLPPSLLHIDTETGEIKRTTIEQGFVNTILFSADRERAFGIEWRCGEGGDCFESLFLHRYNLETQRHVRVGELRNMALDVGAVMLDDGRLVVAGTDTPLFVVDGTTGKTAPVRTVSNRLENLALTVDGSTIIISGSKLPLTAIPVSALPKP